MAKIVQKEENNFISKFFFEIYFLTYLIKFQNISWKIIFEQFKNWSCNFEMLLRGNFLCSSKTALKNPILKIQSLSYLSSVSS